MVILSLTPIRVSGSVSLTLLAKVTLDGPTEAPTPTAAGWAESLTTTEAGRIVFICGMTEADRISRKDGTMNRVPIACRSFAKDVCKNWQG